MKEIDVTFSGRQKPQENELKSKRVNCFLSSD